MDLDASTLSLMLQLFESDPQQQGLAAERVPCPSQPCASSSSSSTSVELMERHREKVQQLCEQMQQKGHAKHLNLNKVNVREHLCIPKKLLLFGLVLLWRCTCGEKNAQCVLPPAVYHAPYVLFVSLSACNKLYEAQYLLPTKFLVEAINVLRCHLHYSLNGNMICIEPIGNWFGFPLYFVISAFS